MTPVRPPESTPTAAAARPNPRKCRWGLALATAMLAPAAAGAAELPRAITGPISLQQPPESVYAPPVPPRDDQGVNQGAINVELSVSYLTDYVFRGIERFEYDPDFALVPPPSSAAKEDYANLQIDGKLSFDLGRFPSPFVQLFVNVAEAPSGDESSFQEIQPTVGFDWTLRPLIFTAGHTSFIFPESSVDANGVPESSEVFARLEIDDGYFFRTPRPVLSPYVLAAYDYDEFKGLYLEAGVRHVLPIEDTPITLIFDGSVAYVSGMSELYGDSGGFQHYQLGLTGDLSLNNVFNFSKRYGEWSFRGYLNYTGEIDEDLRASSQMWGGAGIAFRY